MVAFVSRNWTNCTYSHEQSRWHKAFHFADVNVVDHDDYAATYFGAEPYDVVHAIKATTAVLKCQTGEQCAAPAPFNLPAKREALLLIAHYVGDVHQPLQVGAVYLDPNAQETGGDAGRETIGGGYARAVMAETRALNAAGLLPPPPPEVPHILDKTVVAIDPHMSIHAVDMTRALAPAFDAIGLEVLHNDTPMSFVTSDNPVLIFDPSIPEQKLKPYVLNPNSLSVELLFPIDPRTLLRGHHLLRADFARCGVRHRRMKSIDGMRRANRLIARFAYEAIVAADEQHGALAQTYAEQSPVLGKVPGEPEGLGRGRLEMTFGARRAKPKWPRS